jgi:hypothetical protein
MEVESTKSDSPPGGEPFLLDLPVPNFVRGFGPGGRRIFPSCVGHWCGLGNLHPTEDAACDVLEWSKFATALPCFGGEGSAWRRLRQEWADCAPK